MIKKENTKLVHSGSIGEIYQTTLVAEDGRSEVEEYIIRRDSVMVLPIDNEKRVILIREYSPAYEEYEWILPRGGVEEGEDLTYSADRELQEEAGYKAQNLEKLISARCVSKQFKSETHIFLATDLSESKLEGDEIEPLEIQKFTISEIEKMIESGEINEIRLIGAFNMIKDRF